MTSKYFFLFSFLLFVHAWRLETLHSDDVKCNEDLNDGRFLVSFGGKYLTCDYCVALPFAQVEGGSSLDHQLYKIHIRHSEPNLVGPAFIEVENESGLSNFLPILIADREICHEMRKFQQTFKASNLSIARQCEASSLRQMTFSELLLDIAWSLKNPCENFQPFMTPLWNKRLNALLDFSLRHDLTTILDRIHQNLRITMDKSGVNNLMNGNGDADMRQLQECIDYSIDALLKKGYRSQDLAFQLEYTMQEGDIISDSCSGSDVSSVPTFSSEDLEVAARSVTIFESEDVPLLSREVVTNIDLVKQRPTNLYSCIFSRGVSRSTFFLISAFAVCLVVCSLILHPREVGKFAVSIRRCLTDSF
uniref:Squamosa promoter-binding-like protein 7 isoform X2 n=1 Tax=Rhizophora mucronata TaxID=61149 RepID=A0A2P2LXG1_RHIMU